MRALRSGNLGQLRGAIYGFLSLLTACSLAQSAAQAETSGKSVTIFAAASTTNAVSEILELYSQQTGNKARAVFAASSTLARQIANGAPADLFLSANQRWMDYLLEKAAVDAKSAAPLLSNRLVLVVSASNPIASEALPDVVGAETPLQKLLGSSRLSIGDPAHVPAGIYAKAALKSEGLWEDVASKLAFSGNVRAALALVERGEAAAGIVYETDARVVPGIRRAGVFPESSHPQIVYSLAVTAEGQRAAAESFYSFLRSPQSREVFTRHGFSEPAQVE